MAWDALELSAMNEHLPFPLLQLFEFLIYPGSILLLLFALLIGEDSSMIG
jgi:hypothetical protein